MDKRRRVSARVMDETNTTVSHDKPRKKSDLREKLKPGTMVYSPIRVYIVESLLGSGGSGDVYKVCTFKDRDRHYAMKTELNDGGRRLKIEASVFEEIERCNAAVNKTHFLQMFDMGKSEKFKYIVMDLVGSSIFNLPVTSKLPFQRHSTATIIHIARQTLHAIEALHVIGFIHRDIKPQNFAVGLHDARVFMLDFGYAHKYLDAQRRIRVPRERARFCGTVLYASRTTHELKEQSRRDDIESWFYMLIELFNDDYIRWERDKTDLPAVHKHKVELMTNSEEFQPVFRVIREKKLFEIRDIVNNATYTTAPDYIACHRILDEFCKEEGVDERVPPDWVRLNLQAGKQPKKKKANDRLMNDEDTAQVRRRANEKKKRQEKAEERKRIILELGKVYMEMNEKLTPEEITDMVRRKLMEDKDQKRGEKSECSAEGDDEDEEEKEEENRRADRDAEADLLLRLRETRGGNKHSKNPRDNRRKESRRKPQSIKRNKGSVSKQSRQKSSVTRKKESTSKDAVPRIPDNADNEPAADEKAKKKDEKADNEPAANEKDRKNEKKKDEKSAPDPPASLVESTCKSSKE